MARRNSPTPEQPMSLAALQLLVAAAECAVFREPEGVKVATWVTTIQDESFDVESTLRYLPRANCIPNESLLRHYARTHQVGEVLGLRQIADVAPWITCLDLTFENYSSFDALRDVPRYSDILTFLSLAASKNASC